MFAILFSLCLNKGGGTIPMLSFRGVDTAVKTPSIYLFMGISPPNSSFFYYLIHYTVSQLFFISSIKYINIYKHNKNNNEKLVLRHKMQMQTQQRTPLSNRETRNERNVSSAYS